MPRSSDPWKAAMDKAYPEPTEVISRVPLFTNLGKRHLKSLSESAKQSSYDAGRKIVEKGERTNGLYVILDGQVEVTSGDKVLANLGKGNFFGEVALFDNQPRSADVIAVTPTTCLSISGASFGRILEKEPKMIDGIIRELAGRLRKANAMLTD